MSEDTRAQDSAEHISDPAWGVCARCMELGPWMPFFQGYRCPSCVRWYSEEIEAGRWPFTPAVDGSGRLRA